MADQNTVVGNRYAPTVNYGAAVKAPIPIPRDFPKYKSDVNIDVSGIADSLLKAASNKAAKEQEAGYNKYALAVDDIVQGQRQGRYNYEQAETRIRSLTDQYMASGYDALELAKRRDKYDGGLYKLSQDQQKIIADHETKRQTAQMEEFRANNDYAKGWSDSRVQMYIDRSNQIQDTVDYYNTALNNPGLADEDRERLTADRDAAFEDLGIMNIHRLIQNRLNSGEEITQEFFTDLGNLAIAEGVRSGMDYRDATLNKDAMMRAMDVGTLMQNKYKDVVDNTEAMKKVMNYLDAGTQRAIRSIPEGAIMYNVPHEVIPYFKQGNEAFLHQFANKVYNIDTVNNQRYLLGQPIDKSIDKDAIQVSATVLRHNITDSNYPLSLLSRQAAVFSQDAVDYNGDLKNLTPDQAVVTSQNTDDMLTILNDPALKRRMDQAEPDLKQQYEDNVQAVEGMKAYADAVKEDPMAVDNLKTLVGSFQADRLRYDPKTGDLVMTEAEAFTWKDLGSLSKIGGALGRVFSNDETLSEVDRFNKDFARLSPKAKQALINNLSNGAVKPLGDTEKVVNREDQGLFDKGLGAAQRGASELLQAAERLEQSITRVEQSGATTEPGKLERDKEAVKAARAKAQELTSSAKVSGSVSVAGAALRPAEDSDGQVRGMSQADVEQLEMERELIEAEMDRLSATENFDQTRYQKLSNRLARIGRLLEAEE